MMNFDDDYNNSEFASAIENIKSALYDITSTINVIYIILTSMM